MGKAARASHHVEVERKFDVPADDGGTAQPSFDGLAAVARVERLATDQLEAVYVDTADRDLAAHRIVLRRRTGGADAGWHLKLPGSGEARTEMRAPLQDAVPEELRDTVLAIVRDRPLMPVARVSNMRTVTLLYGVNGSPLAEFCDDRVTACLLDRHGADAGEPQHWREWELELLGENRHDGDLFDRLSNRLLDAGATPAKAGSKLARTLGDSIPARPAPPADPVHRAVAQQIGRLLETDRAVRADEYDAVHQMRVATRQIRSLLQASEKAFGLTDDAWILSELRELAAVLGTARDAEVLAERYRAALHGLAPVLVRGPVADRLVEGARRHYRSGLRRSWTAMRSERYFRLLDALDSLALAAPAAPAEADHHATVSSSYRKVRKAAKAAEAARKMNAAPAERDHAVHRIRKAAKRLRYVAAATGRGGVERRAKEIQTLLGDHQDSVVSREHLLRQADAAHAAGEDTFTYGVLYQREADLAAACERRLGDALRALRKSVG